MRKKCPLRKRIEALPIGKVIRLKPEQYRLANNLTQRVRLASGAKKKFSLHRTAKQLTVSRERDSIHAK